MFDLGFPELVTIFVIALVVLGPKRMAELAGKVGRWVGKARSMARTFRQQLESEINLDDLNRSTWKQTEEARQTPTPPVPPDSAGSNASSTPQAAQVEPQNLAGSGYPYGPPDPDPATAPQPGDDTYSHAHEAGAAPMVDVAEEPAVMEHKRDTTAS